MPINTNLLIAAPMLQDLIVDKNGIPMAAGVITCYHDNARTTLKNWYYQTGAPGAYTYTQLPNPLTLSGAGTICDINGVDTIPFFYPYLESEGNISDPTIDTYYIYIESADGQTIITRQNFPFLGNATSANTGGVQFNNLITNGGFWRNIAPNATTTTPFNSTVLGASTAPTIPSLTSTPYPWVNNGIIVAPSQHDGFNMPDIEFFRNTAASTDTLTFVPFPLTDTQIIEGVIFPEYYANHVSTASAGESYKYYQFPIDLHLNQLANAPFTVSILANSPQSQTINLQLLQYLGTGAAATTPTVIGNTSLTLSPSWELYTLNGIFPGTQGDILGQGADDAWYIQVALPINANYTVNFTSLSLYLTGQEIEPSIPGNAFETYDQIDSIINTPRTGDIRMSMNSFFSYGWVPMTNQLIGLSSRASMLTINYARQNVDTWPLYKLLWEYAKPFDTGSNLNVVCQIYSNNGSAIAATNYGTNAYSDFIAFKALQLTKMMGQVITGTAPLSSLSGGTYYQGFTASNSGGNTLLTITNSTFFFNGQPIIVFSSGGTLPGSLPSNNIYYVSKLNDAGANTFFVTTSFANAIAGTSLVPYVNSGSGTINVQTMPAGTYSGEYNHTQLVSELANHTHDPGAGISNYFGQAGAGTSLTGPGAQNYTGASTTGGITSWGGPVPFNVVQPSSFYNMFIKL